MKDLEKEILDIINTTVKGKYISKLEVSYSSGIYTLKLYLDMEISPSIIMGYEGTEDEFKEYIRKEFKKRKLQKVFFYKLKKEDPFLECADDK
jgi:hypothetical protein